MKTNKLSLFAALALGALLAFTSSSFAQDAKEGGKDGKKGNRRLNAERQLEMMTERLKLTDEQKPKVKAVLEARDKKMQDIAPEDRRDKMPAVMEETDKKLKEILTADQYTQYEKMREEMRNSRKGGKKADDTKKE